MHINDKVSWSFSSAIKIDSQPDAKQDPNSCKPTQREINRHQNPASDSVCGLLDFQHINSGSIADRGSKSSFGSAAGKNSACKLPLF